MMKPYHLWLLSILSGCLIGFSWPTEGIILFLFIGFVPLLLIEDYIVRIARSKHGFLKIWGFSYLSFFLWNIISLRWLYHLQDPDGTPSWLAFLGAVVLNALFMSMTFAAYSWVKKRTGELIGYIFFIFNWLVFEKLHLSWDLSFPWLNIGNGFANHHQWIQWYEYTGTFGGSLWVLVINMGLFLAIKHYLLKPKLELLLKRCILLVFSILSPILASLFMYNRFIDDGNPANITILQTDLDPYTEKFNWSSDAIVANLNALIQSGTTETTDYILAPETSILDKSSTNLSTLQYNSQIQSIRQQLRKYPTTSLIAGIPLYQIYDHPELKSPYANLLTENQWVDFYNAAIQLNATDSIPIYNKSKLVIGVETLPYPSLLNPLIGTLLLNLGGTVSTLAPQKERKVFSNPFNEVKPGVIICYESIYGEFVTEYIQHGANLLFVITNDGWWGDSDGRKQHLAYAKLRAIENRRNIARSANTGVSAFINARGDIYSTLRSGSSGYLSTTLSTNDTLTFYSLYGDVIARIALLLAGIIWAFAIAQGLTKTIKSLFRKFFL